MSKLTTNLPNVAPSLFSNGEESVFEWELNGYGYEQNSEPDASALLGAVQIFGIHYHVEAIAVDENGDAENNQFQSDLDRLADINGDSPFQTVPLFDRNYVVFFYPFTQ